LRPLPFGSAIPPCGFANQCRIAGSRSRSRKGATGRCGGWRRKSGFRRWDWCAGGSETGR